MVSEILYSGTCNGRYGTDCYYLKIIKSTKVVIGLNFILWDYESINFKLFISASLTRLLVHEIVINTEFEGNGTHNLRNTRQYIQNQLTERNVTFYR